MSVEFAWRKWRRVNERYLYLNYHSNSRQELPHDCLRNMCILVDIFPRSRIHRPKNDTKYVVDYHLKFSFKSPCRFSIFNCSKFKFGNFIFNIFALWNYSKKMFVRKCFICYRYCIGISDRKTEKVKKNVIESWNNDCTWILPDNGTQFLGSLLSSGFTPRSARRPGSPQRAPRQKVNVITMRQLRSEHRQRNPQLLSQRAKYTRNTNTRAPTFTRTHRTITTVISSLKDRTWLCRDIILDIHCNRRSCDSFFFFFSSIKRLKCIAKTIWRYMFVRNGKTNFVPLLKNNFQKCLLNFAKKIVWKCL